MSKLIVTQIETADTITPLTITTGNTGVSGSIVIRSSNNDIVINGNARIATISGNVNVTGIITATQGISGAVNVQIFNASGTWNKPPGAYSQYKIEAWGGGGSGAKVFKNPAGGGGGGGYWTLSGPISDLGSSETIVVGLGGASVTVANTSGNQGQNTTVTLTGKGYTLFVGGGGPGRGGTSIFGGGGGGGSVMGAGNQSAIGSAGVAGGTDAGAGADNSASGTAFPGLTGGGGGGGGANNPDYGANSVFGGAGGAGGNGAANARGGFSTFGGNGGASGLGANNGVAGTAPGGGGGSANTGNSGAGGNGRVIITVW